MSLSGPCECCPNDKGPFVKFMTMVMCMDCYNKEKALQAANNHPVTQQNRVNEYRELSNITVAISRETDAALQVRTDLFNASTTSILELKKLIDEDETITNKPYALASELKNRFNHFKQIIFKAQEEIIDATSNQRAIQSYLNQIANQLRAEEREKLKIADLNYRPNPVKPVSSGPSEKTVRPRKPKFDMGELRKFAKEMGIDEAKLRMVCVAKGLTVEAAAKEIKASLLAAQAEQAKIK